MDSPSNSLSNQQSDFIPCTNDKKVELSIVEYDANTIEEKDNATIEECVEHLNSPQVTWIRVSGYDASTVSSIGKSFNIHPLAIEDIINTHQRAKLDQYSEQIFITVRYLWLNGDNTLKDSQVSLVIGKNYLISFSELRVTCFNAVFEKLHHSNHRIRKLGPDYLAYAILDAIIDQYFVVLELMDDKLVSLEKVLTYNLKPNTIQRIQKARREMIFLRKSIWPIRDVISQFQKLEPPLVNETTHLYMRDVHDHIIRIIDMIEGMRDIVGGMLELYMSNINMRTNEIMKFLTIVSTIFVPLTFITSFYGMNFEYMPELHYRWSYPIVIVILLIVAFAMLLYFRRRRWL